MPWSPMRAAPGRIAAGEVDVVLVGADRIAANGDVVAVAGTYPLALAASAAGLPFLVCVPSISIDPALADGSTAPFDEARPGATLTAAGTRVAPEGTTTRTSAQDVTPAALVTAIVTEQGALRPPFATSIAGVVPVAEPEPEAAPAPAEAVG